MALETGTYISSLNASNPVTGDPKTEGDDHLRLIKGTILASFPGVTGAVTPTHTELNVLDGSTATNSQLTLSGPDQTTSALVTSTGTSLNVTSAGVSSHSGGGILFSAAGGASFAAFKAGVTDLSNNSNGYLSVSLRGVVADAALTEHWRFNAGGQLQNISNTQTSFSAQSTGTQTSGTVAIFGTELFDYGSGYNNSNGIFTAPLAGVYLITVSIIHEATVGTSVLWTVLKNAGAIGYMKGQNQAVAIQSYSFSTIVALAVSDTVKVESGFALSGTNALDAGSTFSARLLG